jgi:hypothetical protein
MKFLIYYQKLTFEGTYLGNENRNNISEYMKRLCFGFSLYPCF